MSVDLSALFKTHAAVVGLAIGALVILIVGVLLPKAQRRLLRGPLILLAIYGIARVAMDFAKPTAFPGKALHFIAVFAWWAGLVRLGFVLFTSSIVARFIRRPWPKIVRDVVQVFLYFGVAMIALRAVGVEPGSLLTTSALLTAVLGLSMQDTLGNLFAGLAIQGQQSISVGDWIRYADGDEGLGEVIEVNWRSTHILTTTRVEVIVPNGVFARSIVRNYSRPTRIVRHDVLITLPYDVSPERARELTLSAARGAEGVLEEPEPFVVVGEFTERGVVYSVRLFINDYGRRDPIEGAFRQRLLYILRRANVPLPFPHRRVELVRPPRNAVGPGAAPVSGATYSIAPARPSAQRLTGARLARYEFFKGFDESALERLAEGADSFVYAPGEAIIRQGETGTELFALERGSVEVLVTPEERPPVRVTVLDAGAIFGEAALLTNERRTATIVALTECEVVAVPRAAFQRLLEAHPELTERLTAFLARRMDQLSQAVSDVGNTEPMDGDRRSDLLIRRIRQFFTR